MFISFLAMSVSSPSFAFPVCQDVFDYLLGFVIFEHPGLRSARGVSKRWKDAVDAKLARRWVPFNNFVLMEVMASTDFIRVLPLADLSNKPPAFHAPGRSLFTYALSASGEMVKWSLRGEGQETFRTRVAKAALYFPVKKPLDWLVFEPDGSSPTEAEIQAFKNCCVALMNVLEAYPRIELWLEPTEPGSLIFHVLDQCNFRDPTHKVLHSLACAELTYLHFWRHDPHFALQVINNYAAWRPSFLQPSKEGLRLDDKDE